MANLFSLFLLLSMITNTSYSAFFTLTNNCSDTVWPGILSNPDKPQLSSTGFALHPLSTKILDVPHSWAGRLWARTLCYDDPDEGFSCETGDCGTGDMECFNNEASPPATHAEFNLNSNIGGSDSYMVSLVQGYNVPILVVPRGARSGGGCNMTGCVIDLNEICPPELKVYFLGYGDLVVACRSGSAEGSHAQLFKNACPKAYSVASNNAKSTFTCAGVVDYLITFCPRTDSMETAERMDTMVPFSGSEAMDDVYVFALILFILSMVILVFAARRAGFF